MRLTNDCYLVTLEFGSGVEHYYRDGERWTKLTTRKNGKDRTTTGGVGTGTGGAAIPH